MLRSLAMLGRFTRDETGVTAVEYGLIVALVATAIFASVSALGTILSIKFANLAALLGITNAAAR